SPETLLLESFHLISPLLRPPPTSSSVGDVAASNRLRGLFPGMGDEGRLGELQGRERMELVRAVKLGVNTLTSVPRSEGKEASDGGGGGGRNGDARGDGDGDGAKAHTISTRRTLRNWVGSVRSIGRVGLEQWEKCGGVELGPIVEYLSKSGGGGGGGGGGASPSPAPADPPPPPPLALCSPVLLLFHLLRLLVLDFLSRISATTFTPSRDGFPLAFLAVGLREHLNGSACACAADPHPPPPPRTPTTTAALYLGSSVRLGDVWWSILTSALSTPHGPRATVTGLEGDYAWGDSGGVCQVVPRQTCAVVLRADLKLHPAGLRGGRADAWDHYERGGEPGGMGQGSGERQL
ncbi:hypothetical protein ScalyP_jg11298, partial [Parmales sp. scaly parma]